MAERIQGSQIAKRIREKVQSSIQKSDQLPGLAAVLVGDDPASHLYVALKERAAKEVGMYFEKITLDADIDEDELLASVDALNAREDIHGILVQLPLPGELNEDRVVARIHPDKDVDGFHKASRERLMQGQPGLVSPVALAVMKLIDATNQPLNGKLAVIVGNNPIFSEPIIELLKEQGVEGQFIARDATALQARVRTADIVIVAVGQANFVTSEMVKDGAVVIDVGTNRVDGRVVGDLSGEAREKISFYSPVPGGVGPLTVAYLLQNTLKARQLQKLDR